MKKLIAAVAVAIMCIAFAGCGETGYTQDQQFELGDNTYALESVLRVPANDTSSTDGYGVSFLQVGNTAPIVISGFGSGTMNTKSAIIMDLIDGDNTIEAKTISFKAIDDVEGYGSRITFYFDIPKDSEMPTQGVFRDNNGGDAKVDINLKGIEIEEETTETTTEATTEATTAAPTVVPTVGVDPNYDSEANKGIGDTDIYEPIESFDDTIADPGL